MKGLIFTYILTYGGAGVAIVNPFYGLLIYVCFAILRPETLWTWSLSAGSHYSRIVAVAMLIGWVLQLLIGWASHSGGYWKFGRAKPVVYAFIGFWCWSLISALIAARDVPRALDRVELLAKILLPFLVGITVINSPRQVKQLAWVILLSLGYLAFEMNQTYYSGWNRMRQGMGSLDNNIMAITMVTGVGFAFFLGLGADRWWQKGVAIVMALLMAHAVMFSFSRGGMLALIVTAGVAFVLIPKRPVHYLVFLGVILVGFRLAGAEVVDRFVTAFADAEQRDESADDRLILWGQCWQLMKEHPFLGVGPSHWMIYSQSQFGWPGQKAAHSLWMHTGAELGVVGLGLLVAFYAGCIVGLWRYLRSSVPVMAPFVREYSRMVIAALVGFMVAASFVSVDRLEVSYYVVLLGAAVMKVQSMTEAEGAAVESQAGRDGEVSA